MIKKLTMMDLVAMFAAPRNDHPGRRGGKGGRCGFSGALSKATGNSKWYRRVQREKEQKQIA